MQFETAGDAKDPLSKQSETNKHRPSSTLSAKVLLALIREQVKLNFGDSGAGRILGGLQVKHLGQRTQLAIIKVPRDHCKMVQSALVLITHVQKQPCTVCVRHVSGTIKKCQRAAIRTDRELIISWYRKQQVLSKAGVTPATGNNCSLIDMLKQSESNISALEL
ncbi:RNA-binding protein pop5 [Coemansia sp. RSA 1813]|nr:RNA-binding protein pop5 [Coemansia sp. RSA 487]KAJ2566429.1 RNA-binding protein pop5 [Coemansia sp. RSA 1813]